MSEEHSLVRRRAKGRYSRYAGALALGLSLVSLQSVSYTHLTLPTILRV